MTIFPCWSKKCVFTFRAYEKQQQQRNSLKDLNGILIEDKKAKEIAFFFKKKKQTKIINHIFSLYKLRIIFWAI